MEIIPFQKVEELSKIPKTQSEILLTNFTQFFEKATKWEEKARAIIVTDRTQKDKMKEARIARLELRDIRLAAEEKRVQLKQDHLLISRAIDGMGNVIKGLIVPLEKHLQEQEDFAENLEQQEKQQLKQGREALIAPYIESNVADLKVETMSTEAFNELLTTSKNAHDAKIEEARVVEEQRVAAEKAKAEEDERIRKENEELKAKNDQLEADKGVADQAKAAEQEKKRQAALAPDKDKLIAFGAELMKLEYPSVESAEAAYLVDQVQGMVADINKFITREVTKL